LESTNEIDGSLTYYEMAEDWLSLTRLLCYCENIDKAVLVAESVKDKASCYHIAGQLYAKGDFEKAVKFYTKAAAYGPAMRICKENEMDENLWRLSLMGDSHDLLEAARYFETKEPPDYEKAIHLYHKSGYGSKAMDLAIS
jgi:intraflagellar transport protein 140